MTTKNFCYSANGEFFPHDSMDDLLDELRNDSDSDEQLIGMTYYEAEYEPAKAETYINANRVLEEADELAADEIGEHYEDEFQDVTAEAKAELNALLAAWAAKHVKVSRYWIVTGRVAVKTLTREDVGLPA